jgi:hypothetical protein
VVRLAQARRHQSRQFEANRVVDLVRHGLNSAVLSALCQREAKDWERGACGAGATGSEIQPYLEGGIEEAALTGGGGWCLMPSHWVWGGTVGHDPYRVGPYRVGPYRIGPYRGVGGRRASTSWMNWSR